MGQRSYTICVYRHNCLSLFNYGVWVHSDITWKCSNFCRKTEKAQIISTDFRGGILTNSFIPRPPHAGFYITASNLKRVSNGLHTTYTIPLCNFNNCHNNTSYQGRLPVTSTCVDVFLKLHCGKPCKVSQDHCLCFVKDISHFKIMWLIT